MIRVLIIEDDHMLGDTLALYLQGEGYEVSRVDNAERGLILLSSQPDIIILDLVLPDSQGINPCALIRGHTQAPIIVTSSLTDVHERIRSLTEGADDFMCKPFSMQELKARIEAVLRRSSLPVNPTTGPAPEPGITIDLERRIILHNYSKIETTFSEFEIMKLFLLNPGKVFSRYALIEAIRGVDSYINDRTVDVHITKLRKKLEENPKQPRYIHTIWGVGYKFTP
ncbi:response regulator transcription factor [Paenibacillus massiliensis]|uniref:response regulator transcription factor n=1 Tax=Paenibacillus massiliensis TaxID=225917 RepID=UPI00046EBB9F|nr:response regulator transcription factor [Paenibacillus massiliensis]